MLILASTSRYRRELLERLRLPFEIAAPHVDESPLALVTPPERAQRLALAKASTVSRKHPAATVIGSDQVAVCKGEVLEKPAGMPSAAERSCDGCRPSAATFYTAVAIVQCRRAARALQFIDTTTVYFRTLSTQEIERYIAAEQPFDCAGGFRVEALGIALFARVVSEDPTALIGLPLIAVARALRQTRLPAALSAARGARVAAARQAIEHCPQFGRQRRAEALLCAAGAHESQAVRVQKHALESERREFGVEHRIAVFFIPRVPGGRSAPHARESGVCARCAGWLRPATRLAPKCSTSLNSVQCLLYRVRRPSRCARRRPADRCAAAHRCSWTQIPAARDQHQIALLHRALAQQRMQHAQGAGRRATSRSRWCRDRADAQARASRSAARRAALR